MIARVTATRAAPDGVLTEDLIGRRLDALPALASTISSRATWTASNSPRSATGSASQGASTPV